LQICFNTRERLFFLLLSKEKEFEDTKGVIRIRISKKNRQHNGHKKKIILIMYKIFIAVIHFCVYIQLFMKGSLSNNLENRKILDKFLSITELDLENLILH